MLYIYLHGFNSAYDPNSPKIEQLRQLGDVIGITYNSFATYDQIREEIKSQVPNESDVAFIGTSLGGFWAAEMGRIFGVPSIIINPCHDPYEMLRKYVGNVCKNYQTGVENVLTNDVVQTYPNVGLKGYDRTFGFLPLVLLDMGDEVIDSPKTLKTLEGFPTMFWRDGSHRFDHMDQALSFIRQYVNMCSVIENMNF